MSARPAYEPSTPPRLMPRLLDDASQFSPALGCRNCPDFGACGGLHVEAGPMDCAGFCTCSDRSRCDMVCRNKAQHFFDRYQEVQGWDLNTIPRVGACDTPDLPDFVPLVGHRYSRTDTVQEKVVALSLYDLFHMGTGEPKVRNRAELADRFLVPQGATIVVTGVDRDKKLEAWWAFENREVLLTTLRDLGVALVTGPNFSLFTDTPRPDNLHSMKRIGLSWAELMASGVPAALHLNARTDHDYRRWAQFIKERPEVTTVAFEFGTGAGYPGRIDWHIERLCALADRAGRPLMLVIRGGIPALARLRRRFAKVVLIETDAFARTLKRRRAQINAAGRLRWMRVTTDEGAPLDELLAHNIEVRRRYLSMPLPPPLERPRLVRPPKGSTKHADGEARQLSPVPDIEVAGQARAVSADLQDMVSTSKA